MDYFATYDSVTTLGNLVKVAEEKFSPHFFTAQIDVVKAITKEKYEEVLAEVDTDDYKKIQTAEGYLVLSYAIPFINISSSGDGITKATGYNDSRREILNERDIETIVDRCRDNAEKILQEFRPALIDSDEDENNDYVSTADVKMIAI